MEFSDPFYILLDRLIISSDNKSFLGGHQSQCTKIAVITPKYIRMRTPMNFFHENSLFRVCWMELNYHMEVTYPYENSKIWAVLIYFSPSLRAGRSCFSVTAYCSVYFKADTEKSKYLKDKSNKENESTHKKST